MGCVLDTSRDREGGRGRANLTGVHVNRSAWDHMFTRMWTALVEFVNDVRSELKKISYPTRSETVGSTTVVIVLTVIVSFFLALADLLLVRLLGKII
jgi:preprotein translocase subunit SecE